MVHEEQIRSLTMQETMMNLKMPFMRQRKNQNPLNFHKFRKNIDIYYINNKLYVCQLFKILVH